MGTILFVHGTGVRLRDYSVGLEAARKCALAAGIDQTFVPCAWGDPLGVQIEGKSLPDYDEDDSKQEAAEFLYWSWLFEDPLYELEQMTIAASDTSPIVAMPGRQPEWHVLFENICHYRPSIELNLLLDQSLLIDYWDDAWEKTLVRSPIAKAAFEASNGELPAVSKALARSLVAQLHISATQHRIPSLSARSRDAIMERLLVDWDQKVFGIGSSIVRAAKHIATNAIRARRQSLSDALSLPIGDILLYQSRGSEIRSFIRQKITEAAPPVTVVAHSLGGIACVDLLALPSPPAISHLVTVGSQAPYLYELGALTSLRRPAQPDGFPPWLNIFDRNDFLSYVASRLWPMVRDVEVRSGQPFPESHSAYFTNVATWDAIKEFTAR